MRGQLRTADGFSLIELLIAIAVLGVVLPALGTAFYVSARTVDGTAERVTSAAATTLATADFGRDIQSSLSIELGVVGGCTPPQEELETDQEFVPLFHLNRPYLSANGETLTSGEVTWFYVEEDAGPGEPDRLISIGRRACLASTITTTLPIELAAVPTVACVPISCGSALSPLTSVSLNFIPLEGAPVELHATRRNP